MLDPLLREQPALLEGNSATGLSNRVRIASGFSVLRFCTLQKLMGEVQYLE